MKVFTVVFGAAMMVLGLSSCASDLTPPVSEINTERPQPVQSETATTSEAFISVAGIDVDGAHLSVSGFVTGIIEDGGSCEFSVARNEVVHNLVGTGASNATSTSCGLVSAPVSELSPGTWVVTMTYVSVNGVELSSAPVEVEVFG